jgi:hypothetical protein
MRRTFVVALLVVALSGISSVAFAAWEITGDGEGRAKADSMPTGSTPSATVSNRNVTVTWPQVTIPGRGPADSYRVTRYNESGEAQTIISNCTGQITGLTCTEIGVPGGQWRYSVSPNYALWVGPNGPLSIAVTVNAPSLNLNPTTITQFPAQITATLANFLPDQNVTIRLDGVGGQQLGSLTSGAGGGGSQTVSIPNTVADGAHTLYAVGAGGDQATADFTVNAPFPTPTSLVTQYSLLPNGVVEWNERVEVTFSQALDVASICSTWSGTGNQSITAGDVVTVTVTNNGAPSGNDLLTVSTSSAACGGQFKFGSVDLGSPNYVTTTATFRNLLLPSTIAYNYSSRRLTITLGALANGQTGTVAGATTGLYTPDPSTLGANGRPVTGSVTGTVRF